MIHGQIYVVPRSTRFCASTIIIKQKQNPDRLPQIPRAHPHPHHPQPLLSPPSLLPCQNLEHLDLSQNLLTNALPATIPNLKYLDLTGNNLSVPIPDSFGRFQKLEVLSLVYNLIENTIPQFLGNISTLKMLNLSYNPFHPGWIPAELGNLMNLEVLWLNE